MTTKEEVKTKFDAWLETQPEDVKSLLTERFTALENTVKATREERDNLSSELKQMAKHVDANSDAGKQLAEAISRAETSERKSSVLEDAVRVGVKNPLTVYAVAITENLFTEDGKPDWEQIKLKAPELFTASSINSDAGSGTNQKPEKSFNAEIRKALRNKHRK